MIKVSVIHFQPLEKYPPIMNVLNCLKGQFKAIDVYTIKDCKYLSNQFTAEEIRIYRNGQLNAGMPAFKRYFQYLKFNIKTFVSLCFDRPGIIILYETLSVAPAFFYKKIFASAKIFIHYHEYTSPSELRKNSLYVKWLNKLEKILFPLATWISHTNEIRLQMFKDNYAHIHFKCLQVMPNYPPASWYNTLKKGNEFSRPIKFVYVGALSLETMYTREFATWIVGLNGKATWDIFTGNYEPSVLQYLKALNSPFINFMGEVNYFDLPKILRRYDIGVVLYNGHIPNYVYNAPNKLFEYHACNLDVWFPNTLEGSFQLRTIITYPQIISLDFNNLSSYNLEFLSKRNNKGFKCLNLTAEDSFLKLIKVINN